jgi:hypothetical protein
MGSVVRHQYGTGTGRPQCRQLAWAGFFNTYFWLDPTKRVTGTIMTQLLPFADAEILRLFAQFEGGCTTFWSNLGRGAG